MAETRWGIIGPGGIAKNFSDGLLEAPSGKVFACASRDEGRRTAFADAYGIAPEHRHATYETLAADPEVDAIYIAVPHPFHAEIAIMAMRAGKPVLVEKPAGMNAAQVTALTEVAEQENVFFMEAFMYRCHPQIARMLEIIASGEIGEVRHVRANMGFQASFDPASRLFDRALGGGAILDVGCYPVSISRLIAGAAIGERFDNPVEVKAVGHMGASEVDEETYAVLKFASGVTAQCATSVRQSMQSSCWITGTKGQIFMPDPWVPGRNAGPSNAIIDITVGEDTRREQISRDEHLFAFEAEAASQAIARGAKEPDAPSLTRADSIGNAETLDRWREEIGYGYRPSDTAVNRPLPGVLPKGLPSVPARNIDGVALPVSQLIMGCDNRTNYADGAPVWDAWMEAGGNAFDTAFVYGGGQAEKALGDWITLRGVADETVVVVKGAHSPYCTPRAIEAQLDMSLERLGLKSAPIYIMHRDNPDVPVGEFVDALNRLNEAGRIGIFGGSNWSTERIDEANAYAAANGLQPMRILNNNLSLAVMERPVWGGCVTSNTTDSLAWLRRTNTAHLSWSSQARGYFLPAELRDRLPADTAPETCFGSEANAERRRRADEIASERGVSTHNVATAWVLGQSFPSFALIGPRSPGEIASTLPALGLDLTESELAWLNLEAESR